MSSGMSANPSQPKEKENQLCDVNLETIKTLTDTREQLNYLIAKHLGPRPEAQNAKNAEQSPRSLRTDAAEIRSLAYEISKRVIHLHEIVGF